MVKYIQNGNLKCWKHLSFSKFFKNLYSKVHIFPRKYWYQKFPDKTILKLKINIYIMPGLVLLVLYNTWFGIRLYPSVFPSTEVWVVRFRYAAEPSTEVWVVRFRYAAEPSTEVWFVRFRYAAEPSTEVWFVRFRYAAVPSSLARYKGTLSVCILNTSVY